MKQAGHGTPLDCRALECALAAAAALLAADGIRSALAPLRAIAGLLFGI